MASVFKLKYHQKITMSKAVSVYSYSGCTTCKKALKWLEDNKINFSIKDIVQTPPTKDMLVKAIEQLGSRKDLFNTNGLSYRNLGAKVVQAMNNAEALEALLLDGKLIRRPFLISQEGKILVGFKPDIWTKILLD